MNELKENFRLLEHRVKDRENTIKKMPASQSEELLKDFLTRISNHCRDTYNVSYPRWMWRDFSYSEEKEAEKEFDSKFESDKKKVIDCISWLFDWMDSDRDMDELEKQFKDIRTINFDLMSVRWQYMQTISNSMNWLLRERLYSVYDCSILSTIDYFQAFWSSLEYCEWLEEMILKIENKDKDE